MHHTLFRLCLSACPHVQLDDHGANNEGDQPGLVRRDQDQILFLATIVRQIVLREYSSGFLFRCFRIEARLETANA